MKRLKKLDVLTYHKDYYNSISVGLFIKFGSKNETEEDSGISHFIEHMLFRTNKKNRNSKIIVEELGGYVNAYTTKEYICIHGKILSNYQEILINTILDIVLYPCFSETDIKLEKQVVLNELWNYENNEEIQCQNKLMNTMLESHPLSRTILGTKNNIKNFEQNYLQLKHIDILKRNKVLSIAGNIDSDKINNILEQRINEFPDSDNSQIYSIEKINNYKQINLKRQNNRNVNTISHAFPGIEYSNKKIMLYNILTNILGYHSSSILNQKLREDKGLVYNVNCLSYSFEEGGIVLISCSTHKPENIAVITDILYREYDRILEKGISLESFNMMKEVLKTQILFNSENPSNIMFDRGKSFLLNISGYKDINYECSENLKSDIDLLKYSDLNKILTNIFSNEVSTISSVSV
ncbi:peptidase M16 [Sporosarcina sp. NCCP-2222]|uniref:M16 family metallopeptidase n=1 Tax=Sporosarcina sp. NCCP-2222 TaxID=2935073 RepID=UPI002081E554|nr:pitrilysin family protein [Sporosarcina sp. NCCP-2222]GKV55346.1 peptidase M16 [Sporosarcina sp. NCCP-2222]